MLELLDATDTIKNSPDSNMASCIIVIVAQSVIPDVLIKVNDSVIGVKSRNAEKERKRGRREARGGRERGRERRGWETERKKERVYRLMIQMLHTEGLACYHYECGTLSRASSC